MSESIFPHVPTLSLSTVMVAMLLGCLLLLTWLQNRREGALLYWAPAFLLVGLGLGLLALRGAISDFLSMALANAAMLLAVGLTWAGAAVFHGRRVAPLWYLLAPAAWIAACQMPFFAGDLRLRIAVASVALGTLALLAAIEFWRGRDEPLVSRWPAISMLGFYSLGTYCRIVVAYIVPLPDAEALFQSQWFAVTALATLVFVTILPFMLLALTKERTELLYKRAALTDPLTGLLNRRAFLARGDACIARHCRSGRPLSALLCDLDRFKEINDRFGHAAGDTVLQQFSEAVQAELRAGDIIGRIGGEEFAALLPDCDEAHAAAAAERVRCGFAAAARAALPEAAEATVSIGVAALGREQCLTALLARADLAVYRAKHEGRNCIRQAEPEPEAEPARERPRAA